MLDGSTPHHLKLHPQAQTISTEIPHIIPSSRPRQIAHVPKINRQIKPHITFRNDGDEMMFYIIYFLVIYSPPFTMALSSASWKEKCRKHVIP